MKNRVIVFGGSGFLGAYLIEDLIRRDYQVMSADLVPSKVLSDDFFLECDIMDSNRVREILAEDWDFVFNLAGFANLDKAVHDPVSTVNLNVIGNLNILEAIKSSNVKRYMFASSAYAMSDKGSFYGISKLASEKLIGEYYKMFGLKYTIIRYGSVYGERVSENNYIYSVIKEAIDTQRINHSGDGEEVREYIHAADAARLSVDLIEDDKYVNEHIILTGLEKMKRIELFQMIKEILNKDIEISLKKNDYKHHYKLTPYSFHPSVSKKLISNPYIDMGQGILECIKEIHKAN